MTEQVGVHVVADFWNSEIIESTKEIKDILTESAIKANSELLKLGMHKFQPQGLTAFALLAESHISIHTWPETRYVAIDIFTCGSKALPYKALDFLKKKFKPKKVQVHEIKRGGLVRHEETEHAKVEDRGAVVF